MLSATTQTLRLGADLLLRLGGRELGLPDRQRDLPAGAARDGDRPVLRGRHGAGRPAGLLAVRPADRHAGTRVYVFYGDLLAAAVLLATVVVVAFFGVKAERTSLEEIAEPALEGRGGRIDPRARCVGEIR